MNIDQDRYNALAEWAESDKPVIQPKNAQSGTESQQATREMLRRAGGRPSVDPDAQPGAHSPRRQVRLPRSLSDRVDELAKRDNRNPSDLMREAIAEYVAGRDHQQAG
jgi:Ribbon-helix-helix protein, copG family